MSNENLVAKQPQSKSSKNVKLIAKQYLMRTTKDAKGGLVETPIQANQEFEVPESEVDQWIKPISGSYAFSGERYEADKEVDGGSSIRRHQHIRAVLAPAS